MRSSGWQIKAVSSVEFVQRKLVVNLGMPGRSFPTVTFALFSFTHVFNRWTIGGSKSDRDEILWVTYTSLKTLQSCLCLTRHHQPSHQKDSDAPDDLAARRSRSLREGKYLQRQERSTAAGERKKFGKYKGNSNKVFWANPFVRCITLQLWPVTDLQNNYPDV